jgi:hypothetical protein
LLREFHGAVIDLLRTGLAKGWRAKSNISPVRASSPHRDRIEMIINPVLAPL